jgi:hypothetical protein
MTELEKMLEEARLKMAPLKSKYPRVFSKLAYIECEEGWFPLIEDLSANIELYISQHIPLELQDQIHYEQIKQKFGGLRVHMNNFIDRIQGSIMMAESISFRMCEKCGEKATRYNIRNWITTLCPLHYQQALEKKS